ncbi:MAG: hypothetical protein B7Z37_00290 [Verrucomicrobia bacterium 12-59-8]|nr:MAG: hypothetical protein B7Z37_00290 [Verrucomicrobia bacterium 12-59-8]
MKRIHSLLVVLLLLAYAGTATAIMPAMFAALALLDDSHRVLICRTEQGMQVRLHHRENDCTPEVCDHAGMLAKLVICFCRPATEGDHSLSTNQVTGMLTSTDDEAKRLLKDKQCCSLQSIDLDGWQTRVILEKDVKSTHWDCRESSGVALAEMATIRLLI